MTVHVVSATAILVAGERHQTAMCGTDLGTYDQACASHPVGNYLPRGRWADHGVTCPACLARDGE